MAPALILVLFGFGHTTLLTFSKIKKKKLETASFGILNANPMKKKVKLMRSLQMMNPKIVFTV